QCSLDAVASDDAAIPLVGAPALKQLSAETALHHAGTGQHHRGADVVKLFHVLYKNAHLQVYNMFEHKGVAHGDLSADFFVHGIDVSLVDTHALFGQL
ncbi:hypothetical protein EGW08_015337, partial [Elysia chlorotica]